MQTCCQSVVSRNAHWNCFRLESCSVHNNVAIDFERCNALRLLDRLEEAESGYRKFLIATPRHRALGTISR